MSFEQRSKMSKAIINLLTLHYWENDIIKNTFNIKHCEYGYETHIPSDVQKILTQDYSDTGLFIRFSPDFILTQQKDSIINSILLEYKVTATPRFSLKEHQWFFGQVEANALENYIKLTNIGVKVALLIYCPYHPRPLICEYADKILVSGGRQSVKNGLGSDTDYYNIDLNSLRDINQFMYNEFNVHHSVSASLLNKNFYEQLKSNPLLRIRHDKRSPYNIPTGSNWDI